MFRATIVFNYNVFIYLYILLKLYFDPMVVFFTIFFFTSIIFGHNNTILIRAHLFGQQQLCCCGNISNIFIGCCTLVVVEEISPPPHMIVMCFGCTAIHKHCINKCFVHLVHPLATLPQLKVEKELSKLPLCKGLWVK